ncbi:mitochondrial carrier homolog 2 [Drosophila eugracilis]|uniref:mitochondrial carrier homolog 2 n=1 Tax=Drosophila eugracilis TaxID=29029 RepID=UPI0007E7ED31|nr:mitochondrial carrier homolog 2 [Drosophila eugracilis]
MAHVELTRRDNQTAGSGLGGGDADNSALIQRTTAPPMQLQRTEAMMVEPNRLMRSTNQLQSEQDQVANTRVNGQELEIVCSATCKSQDHVRPNQMVRFCLRLGYNALLFPYEMAKVLIQLGHEPLPAKSFHLPLLHLRPRVFLPGVHQYVQHIRRVDGFWGLYRGLPARLAASTVDFLLGDLVLAILHFAPYKRRPKEKLSLKEFCWNLMRNSIRLATAVALSQPFYVIMVRQVAQFVGREKVYVGIFGSLTTLVKQEGYAGLFAGIVPRLVGELSVLGCTSLISHLCHRLLPMSRTQQHYNAVIIQMMASMLAYPLEVTSACMAGTGAPLSACEPPNMPLYNHWADCLTDLYARGGHNRGALLFWRTVPRIQLLRHADGHLPRVG